MKRLLLIALPIMLTACNGGNSTKSQNDFDSATVENTTLVEVADTPQVETPKAITEKEMQPEANKSKQKSPIEGSYYCRKSGDTYILNGDYSGLFMPRDGSSCAIEWYITNNTITVTFIGEMAFLGTQNLLYDKNTKSLIEKSEIYGYLKYKKQ